MAKIREWIAVRIVRLGTLLIKLSGQLTKLAMWVHP